VLPKTVQFSHAACFWPLSVCRVSFICQDLVPDFIPIDIPIDVSASEILGALNVGEGSATALGITANSVQSGFFIKAPLIIDLLGGIQVKCHTDNNAKNLKCSKKYIAGGFYKVLHCCLRSNIGCCHLGG